MNKEMIKRGLAIGALILFGIFLVYQLRYFIDGFLGAIIFYILFKNFMKYLTERRKWKPGLAAAAIMIISFLIIMLPVMGISSMLYGKVSELLQDTNSINQGIVDLENQIKDRTGIDILSDDYLKKMQESGAMVISTFLNSTASILANIAMLYFLLYFFLTCSDMVEERVKSFIPFKDRDNHMLYTELESMTYSNALGIPLLGVIQGTVAGLGFWAFGLPQPLFWAILTAFASIIPVVGTLAVWAPAGIIHMATGHVWQGLAILGYGALIIGNIDNVVRFMLQKKFADVHPIVTVLGVIMGLDLFGLPGLIFGPLLISYFLIFVRMYRKEYLHEPVKRIPKAEHAVKPNEDS